MKRLLCVHGHFYQPPREHPGLEEIEQQDSAAPYHDWNERITAECYGPMAAARILDEQGRICALVNNYARVSFNFGPTLLTWMERHSRGAYDAVLAADREAARRFSGHGTALAQAYHHAILPLCNDRDRRTQVRWGLADFEHRFGRPAEGMWLPECAVDTPSLEALAAEGVAFTVLAPRQARRVRAPGGDWADVVGGVDPRRPYRVRLPSGRSIAVFFYDGPASQAVAFERLLDSGARFADRLLGLFDDRDEVQLVHIATDGETYGHHHRFGEMALAHALADLEGRDDVELTVYGEHLERHPPTWEAEIEEPSSWSCAHGVERWRSDCGCRAGSPPGWSQAWRAPLRRALDLLRDEVAAVFERVGGALLRDPWAARDDLIRVLLAPHAEAKRAFLADHARRALSREDEGRAWTLLEQQRHALFMFTSCGWFFDDLAGIEAMQVLAYADRVLQLGAGLLAPDVEARVLAELAAARANRAPRRSGRDLLLDELRPRRVTLRKVAAHTAIGRLLEPDRESDPLRGFHVVRSDEREHRSGRYALVHGRVTVASERTAEQEALEYAALHLGDHSVAGGVRPAGPDDALVAVADALREEIDRGDVAAAVRELEAGFGEAWSMKDLFLDPQRRLVEHVLASRVAEVDGALRRIVADHRPLRRFLADLGVPLPESLKYATAAAFHSWLRAALSGDAADEPEIRRRVEEALEEGISLREAELAHALRRNLERAVDRLSAAPDDALLLDRARRLTRLAAAMPFDVDLGDAQNACWRLANASAAPPRNPEFAEWCGEMKVALLGR